MEYPNIATIAAIMSFTSAGLSRDSSGQPEPDTDLNDTENVPLKENVQTYVHPMKNYLPNGEVVLRYSDGGYAVTSLIPPFNLDCYFQHFSLEGVPVPFGQLGPWPSNWTAIHRGMASPNANALAIDCDPSRVLVSVELRATCSEAVIGLAGMTAPAPKAIP